MRNYVRPNSYRLFILSLAAATTLPTCLWPAEPIYIGTSSCSQFACHGRSSSPELESWKSAYTVWATRDPHVRAWDALFSPRAERMFELLDKSEGNSGEQAKPKMEKTEKTEIAGDEYRLFLERRCIACHATPQPNGDTSARPMLVSHSDGVSCESCHGAAGGWVAEHATQRWSENESRNFDRWGMRDTESLTSRAAVCTTCHVGPRDVTAEKQMAVDHDLIAAGHPRLAFELNAYLSKLPPHWDSSKDVRRHERKHGSRSFHFDAWRAGQWQTAVQLTSSLADVLSAPARPNSPIAIDFEYFNCSACHSRLVAQTPRARSHSTSILPLHIADEPLSGVRILLGQSKDPMLNALSNEVGKSAEIAQGKTSELKQLADHCIKVASKLRGVADDAVLVPVTVADRTQILFQLSEQLEDANDASWDRAVQFYLALQSYLDDQSPNSTDDPLLNHASDLFQHLDTRFGNLAAPTIYDSPDAFDATNADFVKIVQAIRTELSRSARFAQKMQ
jgi:hypothetical protein